MTSRHLNVENTLGDNFFNYSFKKMLFSWSSIKVYSECDFVKSIAGLLIVFSVQIWWEYIKYNNLMCD